MADNGAGDSLKTGAEHWKEHFDARLYLNTLYGTDLFTKENRFLADYFNGVITKLTDMISSGQITGKKVLDFGCGPAIQYAIAPSKVFDEIYFADFEENLRETKKWIEKSPNAYDWTHFFEQYAKLEGLTATELETRLRSKIKGTISYKKSLIEQEEPITDEEFDLVMANNCLLVICNDVTDYTKCLKKLKQLIKPGGHLVIIETLGETQLVVGQETFKSFPLTHQGVLESCVEAGYKIVDSKVSNFSNAEVKFVDSTTWHFTIIQKPKAQS